MATVGEMTVKAAAVGEIAAQALINAAAVVVASTIVGEMAAIVRKIEAEAKIAAAAAAVVTVGEMIGEGKLSISFVLKVYAGAGES